MPRGAANQVVGQSMNVSNQATGLASQQERQAAQQQKANQSLENSFVPGYEAMASGILPSEQKQEIGTTAASAQDALARRAAARRNSAGLTSGLDQMARDRMAAVGQAGLKERQAGLEGLSSLYGMNTNLLARELGLPTESLNAASGALHPAAEVSGQPSFWDQVAGALVGTAMGNPKAGIASRTTG